MRWFICIACLLVFSSASGQYKGPRFPINDEWFWTYGAKGLQVGDKMPDIALGATINNPTGKTKISQFKGKLVILDFWNTSCPTCIASFPKMETLQKEFGDQVQIILVNPWETKEQINEQMGQKHLKLPNLPCMVSSRTYDNASTFDEDTPMIAKYFPTRGVPHHVWIDGKGIIRLRGGARNTYAAKIKEFLSGRGAIQVMKDDAILPDLIRDSTARYYQQLGSMQHTSVNYGSFITPYTNEVTGHDAIREIVDSSTSTRTITYINVCLLNLYFKCFNNEIADQKTNLNYFFSPHDYPILDFLQFPKGLDTSWYSSEPLVVRRSLTTEEIIRSKYCYEQVIPLAISKAERYQMMLEDLNRYFKVHYGIVGNVKNKKVPYYEVVRISDEDKIASSLPGFHANVLKQDGQLVLDYQGSFHEFFIVWLRNKQLKIAQEVLYDSSGHPFFLYGSGWDRKKMVAMKIPLEDLHTVADLRRLLQPYGLDIREKYGELPFFVFTRTEEQANEHKQ